MEKIFGIVHMDIAPGQADVFRERAIAALAAARADLAGTTAYEWFMAEDGESCTVIEIYDGPEAVAHHGKMVGQTIAAIREVAEFHIDFAGEVPDPVIDRMRKVLGAVDYFGPRFQGKLTAPAAGTVGADAGAMIFAVARWTITPGKEAEFRALAEEVFALVDANEPDTIGYEWFLSPDGGKCLTIDVYRNVAGLGAHMKNAGPTMSRILELLSESDTRLYGAVPPAVRERFKPELGVRYVAPQLQRIM